MEPQKQRPECLQAEMHLAHLRDVLSPAQPVLSAGRSSLPITKHKTQPQRAPNGTSATSAPKASSEPPRVP